MESSVSTAISGIAQRRAPSAVLIERAPMDFETFFQAEFASMVSLAHSVCGDAAVAEDIAQEAMAKAHQRWAKVGRYDRPGAWLRRVTINQAISVQRRTKREQAVLRRKALDRAPAQLSDEDGDGEVWQAVAKLSPKQRAVVALFYQDGLSTREIAEILDCSISTATSHLSAARKRLAQELGESLDPADDRQEGRRR